MIFPFSSRSLSPNALTNTTRDAVQHFRSLALRQSCLAQGEALKAIFIPVAARHNKRLRIKVPSILVVCRYAGECKQHQQRRKTTHSRMVHGKEPNKASSEQFFSIVSSFNFTQMQSLE
jgi:hypothetical protein